MKLGVSIVLLALCAAPAFARQSSDDFTPGAMEVYAVGDLALADIQNVKDPLQELRRFFVQARSPLTVLQSRELKKNIDVTIAALQSAQDMNAVRKANQDFNKKMFEILSPEQSAALKRYRNEEILRRGGFPALKLILDNAQASLSPDQAKQAEALFTEFNQRFQKLSSDSNSSPDKVQLDKLETDTLGKVVRMLDPAQRRALASSRLGTLTASARP